MKVRHARQSSSRLGWPGGSKAAALILIAAAIGMHVLGAGTTPIHALPGQQAYTCPPGAVTMRPGDNLQNIVNGQPAGTTFCLTPGTYQNQTIRPRTGDTFIGQPGAIMDGGTTTRFAFQSLLSPNPNPPITDVIIRGLTIQRYGSATSIRSHLSPEGAIEGQERWIVEGNLIQDNVAGLSFGKGNWGWGDGAIIRNNRILNNAEIGLEINGSNILFEGNELAGNGWRLTDQDRLWSGGGSKFTDQRVWANNQFNMQIQRDRSPSDHLIIRNNHVHNNVGIGLWLDISNRYAIIENNLVEENYGSGIMDELSTATTIRNNTVRNNRKNNASGGLWGGAELLLVNSQDGDVYGNDVTVSGTGRAVIMIYESYRSAYPMRNYYVHHNTFRFLNQPQYRSDSDPTSGIIGGGGNDPFWNSNNRFDHNTYYVQTSGLRHWFWGMGMQWSAFKTAGHEINGLCYYGPANTPCDPQTPASTPTPIPTTPAVGTPIPPTATPLTPTAMPTSTAVPSGDGAPYRGQPLAIPGRIEAEDFNTGANGAAYYDTTPGNAGGQVYRTDPHDVDLKAMPAYGGHAVGWFISGEWLKYTVNVAQAGYYTITIFGGAVDAGRGMHIEFNGQNVTGPVTMPVTPNWDTYAQLTLPPVYLNAGVQVMRIVCEQGYLDVDWVEFALQIPTPTATGAATAIPTQAPTMTPLPTLTALPTETLPPTPTETFVPPIGLTPDPTLPPDDRVNLRAVVNTGMPRVGENVVVEFVLERPELAAGGIRALEARCSASPDAVLSGQAVSAGTLFSPDPVTINSGFQPDNTWLYATTQSGDNPPISVAGTVFAATFTMLSAGEATLNCAVSAITGERGTIEVSFVAPVLRAALPAPRIGSASGMVTRSHGPAGGITISVLTGDGSLVAMTVTGEDGSFAFADLPEGVYMIRAEAEGYLPAQGPLIINGGEMVSKAPITLLAGYLVPKAVPVIDELDVVQLAAVYGQSSPPVPEMYDINGDGRIGLADLSALAENLRAAGPIFWP